MSQRVRERKVLMNAFAKPLASFLFIHLRLVFLFHFLCFSTLPFSSLIFFSHNNFHTQYVYAFMRIITTASHILSGRRKLIKKHIYFFHLSLYLFLTFGVKEKSKAVPFYNSAKIYFHYTRTEKHTALGYNIIICTSKS